MTTAAAEFRLVADYRMTGDQPAAVDKLVEGLRGGHKHQTLLAVLILSALLFAASSLFGVRSTHAAFPGGNGRIAFQKGLIEGGNLNTEIFVMDADGSNPVNISNNSGQDTAPAWSPDGTRIAFGRDSDIWVMDADGGNQTNLTNSPTTEVDPIWSPDGTRIAFGRGPDGGLYVMNSDGSDVTFLAPNGSAGLDGGASWSPDGSRIAFGSDLQLVNADGTNLVQLPDDNKAGSDLAPSWSPDGNCILYRSYRGGAGEGEIYVTTPDGTRRANLSQHPANEDDGVWSPDGTKIVFTSSRDGNQELYVMDADGGNQVRLTNTPEAELSPDWQPLPGGAAPAPCVIPERPAEPSPSPAVEPLPGSLPRGGGPPSARAGGLPNAALIALGGLALAPAAYILVRISRSHP
jgi:dipeptidyl aminopeptidase/acylaminoacyl peptidase